MTPTWILVGVVLLVLDALLLTGHGLHHLQRRSDSREIWTVFFRSAQVWNGGLDGSLMELFGHVKLAAAALLLLSLALGVRERRVFGAWGGIFLVMVADDFLRLHERVRGLLVPDGLESGLSRWGVREFGGLAFWVVIGTVLGAVLVHVHRASSSAARRGSWILFGTLVPLAGIGVLYVLGTALLPQVFRGEAGDVLAMGRITVKMLTMSLVLVQVFRLIESDGGRSPAAARG